MNNSYLKYGFLVILLIFIQVLLLNNVRFLGYINPIIYILFIFIYPIKENKTSLLISSFFIGLLIDFFSDSGGSNAAAMVFIAFIRLPVVRLIQNKMEFDYLLFHIKKLSFIQIIVYVFSLTFIHHLLLFYLEYYSLQGMLFVLLKVFFTAIFSSIVIGLSISLFVKNTKA